MLAFKYIFKTLVRWLIRMRQVAGILLLLLSFQLQAQQTSIQGLRVWSAPDHTRLVFDTSSAVSYKIFSLKKPDRLVLDFKNAIMRRTHMYV